MKEFLKARYVSALIVFTVMFFVLGVYVGLNNSAEISRAAAVLGTGVEENEKNVDLSNFWKVWDIIDEKYPGADKVSSQDRIFGAISGLLESLNDPYTVFFNQEETKSFEEDISGTFIGIGMEVGMKDKILTVIAPLKDTPAYRAGIKSGDRILKIDETTTAGLSIEKAVKLIRGEKSTEVTLTLSREGEKEPREIKIIRDVINIPTLEIELRADKIFVIKLYSFSANSIGLFRNALKKFSTAKTDKLLLDLRGNPGGYLGAAVDITSWFLPAGRVVVTEDYGDGEKPTIFRSKGYNIFNDKLKFVILMDSGSASASEIVAGAMQDHKRAILVGDTSYGKGSVQELVKVTSDTRLKITVAKWFTPNGISISEKGLTPDYKVEYTKEDAEKKKDPQMEKAVELLNNWPR